MSSFTSASLMSSACASVLMAMNSTPFRPGVDHAVDGVDAAAADADDLDDRQVVLRTIGPTVVIVPAPRVSTMSPGRARRASSAATSGSSGTNATDSAGSGYRVGDQRAGDGRVGVLAGEVHVGDDDLVGRSELDAHLLAEDPGARDQVRLEGDEQAPLPRDRAGGLQVAADLARVVGVAVVDADAAASPLSSIRRRCR
jgi:hypothetical protein